MGRVGKDAHQFFDVEQLVVGGYRLFCNSGCRLFRSLLLEAVIATLGGMLNQAAGGKEQREGEGR